MLRFISRSLRALNLNFFLLHQNFNLDVTDHINQSINHLSTFHHNNRVYNTDMTTRNKLLQYLKKEKENWISGEVLSTHLNVSRAAINKHIKRLRQDGYRIESSTKKGYRIENFQDLLLTDEIQKKTEYQNLWQTKHHCFKKN